jgi:branched-chain amino acid transport system ATP-binding protein
VSPTDSSLPVVALDHVSAGYGGVPVLRDVSVQINRGEIVALLGPNGAGKTTVARVLAGLVAPTVGDVLVDGVRCAARPSPQQRARTGMRFVPESRGVFANLTTRDNLLLGARRDRAALHESIDAFPALGALLDRRAGLLSGGEQQMLALARAIAGRPRVLVIDELSLGLAPLIVDSILESVVRLARDRHVGLLLIEQHVDKVTRVADRSIHLARGSVVAH